MGQKVNPIGIRLGIVRDWNSKWYADSKDYAAKLCTDLKVRDFLKKKLEKAGVSRIKIERPAQNAHITIYTARPGVIIGKKGGDVEALRKQVGKMMGVPVHIDIEEIRRPELDAQLVAETVAQQLEKTYYVSSCYEACSERCATCWCRGNKNQSIWSSWRC